MKTSILFLLLLYLVSSCAQEKKPSDHPSAEPARQIHSKRSIPKDSLHFYTYRVEKSSHQEFPASVERVTDLPEIWVALDQHAEGLFVYHRGKGYARTLELSPDSLVHGGYGEKVKWKINSFKKIADASFFFGLGDTASEAPFAHSNLEILDSDTFFAINRTWILVKNEQGTTDTLSQSQALYIPESRVHYFDQIREPNTHSPDARIEREEIDTEVFRNRKKKAQEK